jgi:hypothetical protein
MSAKKLLPGESNFRDGARRTFQPMHVDSDGVVRFRANAIVDFLLRNGGYDMNGLARLPFTEADRAQFAQLIGYSVSGWGELSYVPLRIARIADDLGDSLLHSRRVVRNAPKPLSARSVKKGRQ